MSDAVVAIVNPQASNGAGGRRWPGIEAQLRQHWPELEAQLTQAPEHATALAREALERGAKLVIAVGGDGTNNEVLAGFLDDTGTNRFPEAVLGVVANGTGGDFQRHFGASSLRRQVEGLAAAPVQTIDYGVAHFTDDAGRRRTRPFLNMVSVGISADVVAQVNGSSRPLGSTVAYVGAALRAISRWQNRPVSLRLDDGPARELALTLLCVGNGRYFGAGMMACPSAQVDSGSLQTVLLEGFSRWGVVGALGRSFRGRHIGFRGICERAADSVELEPVDDAEVRIEVDGEQPGRLPARFELRRAALRLRIAGDG